MEFPPQLRYVCRADDSVLEAGWDSDVYIGLCSFISELVALKAAVSLLLMLVWAEAA